MNTKAFRMDFLSADMWAILDNLGKMLGGGLITLLALVGVARIKASTQSQQNKMQHEIGMSQEQRLWVESLAEQLKALGSTTDMLRNQLQNQQEYYETREAEIRRGYRLELDRRDELHNKKLAEQERHCHEQIEILQKRLDKLEEIRARQISIDIESSKQDNKPGGDSEQ